MVVHAGRKDRDREPDAQPHHLALDEEINVPVAVLRERARAEKHHHAEDDEELLLHREPFQDCLRRILSGEITDSLTVMALLALQARRSGIRAPLDPALAERFFQRPAEHPAAGRARWETLDRP